MARASGYTPELAKFICDEIAYGKSLRTICKPEEMPAPSTICLWLSQHDDFAEQYARAREAQADLYAEECIEIADDGRNDWMERRSEAEKGAGWNAGWVLNGEHVQRSKLRFEARRWYAGKLAPKKYGERVINDNTNNVNVALTILPSPVSRIAADVEQIAGRRADEPLQDNGSDGFVLLAAPSVEKG